MLSQGYVVSENIYGIFATLWCADVIRKCVHVMLLYRMVTEVWKDINRGKFAVQKSLIL